MHCFCFLSIYLSSLSPSSPAWAGDSGYCVLPCGSDAIVEFDVAFVAKNISECCLDEDFSCICGSIDSPSRKMMKFGNNARYTHIYLSQIINLCNAN